MSANSVLQRLSLAMVLWCLPAALLRSTQCRSFPPCHLSLPPRIPSVIYLFISRSFIPAMLSFTRLPSPPPPPTHFSVSSSLPITPFSVLMHRFLCPSLLLFIQHHSVPPCQPASLFSFKPADNAWRDGDWLRDAQREDTAGTG